MALVGRDRCEDSAVGGGVSTGPWIVDDELWALLEPLLPPWPERSSGPRPVSGRLCLPGILYVLRTRRRCSGFVEEGGVAAGKSTAAARGAWIVCEDEASQSLRPPRARTWGRVGRTPVVRVRGRGSGRVSVLQERGAFTADLQLPPKTTTG
ncbi:transposase [Streptomyces celluloflavus]|uniref:transposase n=1 Tax=Streptomyces celluloflavus TaxID=58344 RepID=UPI0036DB36F8